MHYDPLEIREADWFFYRFDLFRAKIAEGQRSRALIFKVKIILKFSLLKIHKNVDFVQ